MTMCAWSRWMWQGPAKLELVEFRISGIERRGSRLRDRGQRSNLIVITVEKANGDLNPMKLMLPGEIDGPLRVLKIQSFKRV